MPNMDFSCVNGWPEWIEDTWKMFPMIWLSETVAISMIWVGGLVMLERILACSDFRNVDSADFICRMMSSFVRGTCVVDA